MAKFFCPYCNPKYQFISNKNTDKLICGLCGEEMLKQSFFNIRQMVSLIIIITFLLPLFYSFFILIMNRKQIKKDIYQGYNIELTSSIKSM